MEKIIAPDLRKSSYTCPHCNAIAGMERIAMPLEMVNEHYNITGSYHFNDLGVNLDYRYLSVGNRISLVTCRACKKYHVWLDNNIIYPNVSALPAPVDDMPEKVKEIYNEAKDTFTKSPRASAALLRLALQVLCKELGEKGENINQDIKSLVGKGLPNKIQEALDSVRVIGNNAVHPGTIDINDNPEVAETLFKIINIIVEKIITETKQIDEIYDFLPEKDKQAIEKRDGN